MKHTPGPWTIHEDPAQTYPDSDRDEGGYRIDASNIEQLAYVWRANKRWGDDPRPFGAREAQANARLIAAAPDLLATLKSAREFVKAELDARVDSHTLGGDLVTLDETDDGICAEAMEMLEQIDAAIERAEGT